MIYPSPPSAPSPPVGETALGQDNLRRRCLLGLLRERFKREQDLASPTFSGEQDPELLVHSAGSDLVDLSSDVSSDDQSLLLNVSHGCGDLCMVFGRKLREELQHRPATVRGDVVTPPPSLLRHLEGPAGLDHLVEALAQSLVEARKGVPVAVEGRRPQSRELAPSHPGVAAMKIKAQ